MTNENNREAFNRYAILNSYETKMLSPNGSYASNATRKAYEAWQAAKAASAEEIQDEVAHYESCECCGNFHRMEQAHDAALKQIATLTTQLDEARKVGGELEKLVYVSGHLRCAKCGFHLVKQSLYLQTGQVGADNSPDYCPNDGSPLWRVTERENGNDLYERASALQIENNELKSPTALVAKRLSEESCIEVMALAAANLRRAKYNLPELSVADLRRDEASIGIEEEMRAAYRALLAATTSEVDKNEEIISKLIEAIKQKDKALLMAHVICLNRHKETTEAIEKAYSISAKINGIVPFTESK